MTALDHDFSTSAGSSVIWRRSGKAAPSPVVLRTNRICVDEWTWRIEDVSPRRSAWTCCRFSALKPTDSDAFGLTWRAGRHDRIPSARQASASPRCSTAVLGRECAADTLRANARQPRPTAYETHLQLFVLPEGGAGNRPRRGCSRVPACRNTDGGVRLGRHCLPVDIDALSAARSRTVCTRPSPAAPYGSHRARRARRRPGRGGTRSCVKELRYERIA